MSRKSYKRCRELEFLVVCNGRITIAGFIHLSDAVNFAETRWEETHRCNRYQIFDQYNDEYHIGAFTATERERVLATGDKS